MQQREATDEWLMQRLAAGDESALERLMERWSKPLLAVISRRTDADAEDIYQETWLNVVRARAAYDASRSFRSWLFRIALNAGRDSYRRRQARPKTVGLEAAATRTANGGDEDAELARDALGALPQPDREIIELRYYQGFRESEVAEALGIPVGTVKSRTHAAVAKLKEKIKGIQT